MTPLDDTKVSPFSPRLVLGISIIAIGLLGFISQFAEWGLLERLWPLLLVGIGALVVRRAALQPKRSLSSETLPPSPLTRVSGDPGIDSTTVHP